MTIMGSEDVLVPSERFMRQMRNEMRIVVEALAARAAADPDVTYLNFVFCTQGPSVLPSGAQWALPNTRRF